MAANADLAVSAANVKSARICASLRKPLCHLMRQTTHRWWWPTKQLKHP
jgi:hypothetical protein